MGVCEEKIYKEIYYKYSEYLRNFLYYKSGNMAVAEDISHDAYMKLWENCGKVEIEKAKSFLFTIANNLFLNRANKSKVVLKFEKSVRQQSDTSDPHYLMQKDEFKRRLELAIANLPENQRVVFLMNRIDKKKYREIAEELDISVKAVEKRMHLALVELRKLHKGV